MKLRTGWNSLLLITAAAALYPAGPYDEDIKALPDGPGKEIVARLCTECHGPANFRKMRHDQDGWTESVADMVDHGAKGTPAELATVVEYLTRNFGMDSKVNVNTAPVEELKAQLAFTVPEGQAVIAQRQREAFKDWRDLLKVSGLDAQKAEAAKGKMSF